MSREGDYSVKKILKDLSKAPPSKQVAVGAGTGWIAGYLTMKAGRSMATAIGGSILLLQVLSRSMLSFFISLSHHSLSQENRCIVLDFKMSLPSCLTKPA